MNANGMLFTIILLILLAGLVALIYGPMWKKLFPTKCEKCGSENLVDCDEGVKCNACGEIKRAPVYLKFPLQW